MPITRLYTLEKWKKGNENAAQCVYFVGINKRKVRYDVVITWIVICQSSHASLADITSLIKRATFQITSRVSSAAQRNTAAFRQSCSNM